MPQAGKRLFLAAIALVFSMATCAQAAGLPHRVASLNLCADQLLLALADRSQILSLSPLARDPTISFLVDSVGDLPVNSGRAETLLFERADMIIMARWGSQVQRNLLERHGFELMLLEPWRSFEAGYAEIRAVAARFGHRERGEALIKAIDAALARAESIVPPGRRVLTLYRRGWAPGTESLTAELLRHMGFTLHEEELGVGQGGVIRLESLVANPPDYVLIDDVQGLATDQGTALLMHPALLTAVPPERRLNLPSQLAICGGPSTPALIDAIAAEVRRKVH